MDGKFLGIGLKNALGLWFLFMLFSVISKTILTQYHVEGLSEVVKAS